MSTETIIACARLKPVSPNEEKECCVLNGKSIYFAKSKENFEFEYIFDEEQSTSEIFESVGNKLVQSTLSGYNACIFAYGQTSSGKTYTMKGNDQFPGIIPLSLTQIFTTITQDTKKQYKVKISYIEIYNEQVIDLLNPKENSNLDIREHPVKGIHIPNLTEISVNSKDEAYEHFLAGENQRKFGETYLNDNSSRSHTIFRINIEIRDLTNSQKMLFSELNLIDLAGSENITKYNKLEIRQKESLNINKSLLALSTVINKLSTNQKCFINFRDSKLTRLLQNSLAGNSRTAIICTINPNVYFESINTLKFGLTAGAIKNKINVNEQEIEEKKSIIKNSIQYTQLMSDITDMKQKLEVQDETQKKQLQQISDKDSLIETLNSQINEFKKRLLESETNFNAVSNQLALTKLDYSKTLEDNQMLALMLKDLQSSQTSKKDSQDEELKRLQSQNQSNLYEITQFQEKLNKSISQNQELAKQKQQLENQIQIKEEEVQKKDKYIQDLCCSLNCQKEEMMSFKLKSPLSLKQSPKTVISPIMKFPQPSILTQGNQGQNTSFSFNSNSNSNCHLPNNANSSSNNTNIINNSNNGSALNNSSMSIEGQQKENNKNIANIVQPSKFCESNALLKKLSVNRLQSGKPMSDDEFRSLEVESQYYIQLMEFNNQLEEQFLEINKLKRKNHEKKEQIQSLKMENEEFQTTVSNKNSGSSNSSQKERSQLSESEGNNISKKRKFVDQYSHIEKKIINSPDKKDLKIQLKKKERILKNMQEDIQMFKDRSEKYLQYNDNLHQKISILQNILFQNNQFNVQTKF